MAAALFVQRTEGYVDRPQALSVGLGEAGHRAPAEVVSVMAARGIELSNHRSTTLSAARVADADLVIGMSLRHVQEAVLADPASWERTFRLKELVRRGEHIGPRLPGQDLASWVSAAQGDRTRDSLANHSPSEDVADPFGGPAAGYETTAVELEDLTDRLVGLLWPLR